MREATDLSISAGVRRELAGRRIDLGKIKFPVKAGVVTLQGELCFVGIEKNLDETAIELKFIESGIKSMPGVKEVIFELENWSRSDGGIWESSQGTASGTSTGPSGSGMPLSGDGIVCPDCDYVIRFCPCCGKPLAGAAKSSARPVRKPAPPVKPVIKKKTPFKPMSPISVAPVSSPAGLLKKNPEITIPAPAITSPATPALTPAAAQPVKPSFPPVNPTPAIPAVSVISPAKPAAMPSVASPKPAAPIVPKEPVMPAAPKVPEPAQAVPMPSPQPINPEPDFTLEPTGNTEAPSDQTTETVPEAASDIFSDMTLPAGEFPEPSQQIESPADQTPEEPATLTEPTFPDLTAPVEPVKPAVSAEQKEVPASNFDDLLNSATDSNSAMPSLDGDASPADFTSDPFAEKIPDSSEFAIPSVEDSPAQDEDLLPPIKPASPAEPSAPLVELPSLDAFDLGDDTPLPPAKPAKLIQPAPSMGSPALDDDTPLPPMKPAAPPSSLPDPLSLDDDDTPLPPMKPKTQPAKESKDPFAALFSGGELNLGIPSDRGGQNKDPFSSLDLDLDVLEVFPSDQNEPPPAPAKKPAAKSQKPTPVDNNPFNLDNVIDLDNPVDDKPKSKPKASKDPFDLDDFDINNFKL